MDLHITINAVNSSHCAYRFVKCLCTFVSQKKKQNKKETKQYEKANFIYTKYTGRKCSIGRSIVVIIVVVNKCVHCKNTHFLHFTRCVCFRIDLMFSVVVFVLFFRFLIIHLIASKHTHTVCVYMYIDVAGQYFPFDFAILSL